MRLHAIGFGSLNLDEFWEVSPEFLRKYNLCGGQEYVKNVAWFTSVYPELASQGELKAADPGGSAANMIAALRKLGFNTGFFGAAGKADAASLRLDDLGDETTLRVLKSDLPSGRCLSLINRDDPGKDRTLVILPNANDLAGTGGFDPDYFCNCRWVHLTSFVSISPLACQIDLVQKLPHEVRVSFDPGAVYSSMGFARMEPILRRADLLFVSEEEVQSIIARTTIEGSVAALQQVGVGTVVLKRGPRGISAFQGAKVVHQPAVSPGRVLDRTGAGDVAAAGFIAGLLQVLTLEESLEFAAIAASRSIEGYGRSTYPDKALLGNFLSARARS